MSRADLAREVKMTRQAIRLIELGHSSPTLATARKIAAALDVPVDELWPEEK